MKIVREKAMWLISLEQSPQISGRENLRRFDAPNKGVHCYAEWQQKCSRDDMNPGAKSSAKLRTGTEYD